MNHLQLALAAGIVVSTSAAALDCRSPYALSAKTMASADFTMCAIRKSGTLACWGQDAYGKYAIATAGVSNILAVSSHAASANFCVLNTTGGVICAGNPAYNQVPVPSWAESGVTAVSVGLTNVCTLNTTGGVRCEYQFVRDRGTTIMI